MEIAKSVKWSAQLENYFKELGEKCYCYAYLHKKAEGRFAYRRNFIDLPVIIGSTIAGTLSIGNSAVFGEENERVASMAIGCLSLAVGVLNTIGSYFAWSKRAEAHRLMTIEYSKLFRFISIELSLPREERMLCADLLKVVRENYERLMEISPLIPESILDDFKKRFSVDKYANISKPSEANGLEEIEIYKGGGFERFRQVVSEAHSRHLRKDSGKLEIEIPTIEAHKGESDLDVVNLREVKEGEEIV